MFYFGKYEDSYLELYGRAYPTPSGIIGATAGLRYLIADVVRFGVAGDTAGHVYPEVGLVIGRFSDARWMLSLRYAYGMRAELTPAGSGFGLRLVRIWQGG